MTSGNNDVNLQKMNYYLIIAIFGVIRQTQIACFLNDTLTSDATITFVQQVNIVITF